MALFKKNVKNVGSGKRHDWAVFKSVRPTTGDSQLLSNEGIYAAVSIIANAVATMPLHLMKDGVILTDDPREKLVSYMPNGTMTPFLFKQTMEAFRNTEGNAYALIIRNEYGIIQRYDVLDASRVTPLRNVDDGELYYSWRYDDGREAMVHSSNMIALHHMSANGTKGIRPIDVLSNTIDYSEQMREFSMRQLEGVNNGILLELPATITDEKRKEKLVSDFIDVYKKSGGQVMVLEGGIKATSLNRTPVDSAALDVERISKNRIATVYGLPPHKMGDYSQTTYATAEESNKEFLDTTLMPIFTQWEQEYNFKTLTYKEVSEGMGYHFDVSKMRIADVAAMTAKYQSAVRCGELLVNDVRRAEGLPPVEGGDTPLVSKDLAPLSLVLKGEVQ